MGANISLTVCWLDSDGTQSGAVHVLRKELSYQIVTQVVSYCNAKKIEQLLRNSSKPHQGFPFFGGEQLLEVHIPSIHCWGLTRSEGRAVGKPGSRVQITRGSLQHGPTKHAQKPTPPLPGAQGTNIFQLLQACTHASSSSEGQQPDSSRVGGAGPRHRQRCVPAEQIAVQGATQGHLVMLVVHLQASTPPQPFRRRLRQRWSS